MGVGYNRFHTTAMCSPTRACVLTGRNHHAVGFGQIPEYATDFDGYVGAIPPSTATVAEVLQAYGYGTAAFGKWHNTPIDQVNTQWPLRSVANRSRVRLLLRFRGGGDLAVRASPVREHHADRAARRSRLPPHRRSGRQGHRIPSEKAEHGPRQADPPLLHPRSGPRATPHSHRVGRSLCRGIRRWLGSHARTHLRQPNAHRVGFPSMPS